MTNDMDVIKKLYVKSKTYKIPMNPKEGQEQVTIEISPLALDEIGLLNMDESQTSKEMSKNMVLVIAKSLKVDESEVKKISVEFMNDLMEAITDANKFSDKEDKTKNIKEFIEQKQELLKNAKSN